MTTASLPSATIVIGVDTHKDNHVAVAIHELGVRQADCSRPATPTGYQQLLAGSQALGSLITFGVEGTGSDGRGLATFLLQQGCSVVEGCRPARTVSGQSAAKDDVIDAEKATRQVLSGQATVMTKWADGQVEMMRVIKIAKETAVKAQSQVLVALKSLLVTADETLITQLESLPTTQLVAACAELAVTTVDTPLAAMGDALATMAQRWQMLHKEIEGHWEHWQRLTKQTAPVGTVKLYLAFLQLGTRFPSVVFDSSSKRSQIVA